MLGAIDDFRRKKPREVSRDVALLNNPFHRVRPTSQSPKSPKHRKQSANLRVIEQFVSPVELTRPSALEEHFSKYSSSKKAAASKPTGGHKKLPPNSRPDRRKSMPQQKVSSDSPGRSPIGKKEELFDEFPNPTNTPSTQDLEDLTLGFSEISFPDDQNRYGGTPLKKIGKKEELLDEFPNPTNTPSTQDLEDLTMVFSEISFPDDQNRYGSIPLKKIDLEPHPIGAQPEVPVHGYFQKPAPAPWQIRKEIHSRRQSMC